MSWELNKLSSGSGRGARVNGPFRYLSPCTSILVEKPDYLELSRPCLVSRQAQEVLGLGHIILDKRMRKELGAGLDLVPSWGHFFFKAPHTTATAAGKLLWAAPDFGVASEYHPDVLGRATAPNQPLTKSASFI